MFSFKIARFNVIVDKLLFYVIRLPDSRILKKNPTITLKISLWRLLNIHRHVNCALLLSIKALVTLHQQKLISVSKHFAPVKLK